MPIFKVAGSLVFYAHVPKCAGSAVEEHLAARFGPLAFHDVRYLERPAQRRWTRTSPQHLDADALARLFPHDFFAARFTVVRHPVGRMVSAYHFQRDTEHTIPADLGFGEWLQDLPDRLAEDPFAHDNHVRPMTEIVPEDTQVFHLEHGLDALIPWLDGLAGNTDGPRAIEEVNRQNDYAGVKAARVTPSPAEIATIARIYAADFDRFGYSPDRKAPTAPAPVLDPAFLAARDAARAAARTPLSRITRRVQRALARRSGAP